MHRLVPQFILENYQAKKYQGSFDAVGLLVDVSGFSTMTDELAQHGIHGSEVLANGMRQVFDPMIQSVLEFGGHVVGFAGDAISAVFPAKESGRDAYIRAVNSALSIQAYRLKNAEFATPYGTFNISVRIGLGIGKARWRIVLSKDGNRATYYFHGTALEEAVISLNRSRSGQVLLSLELYQTLVGKVKGTVKDEAFLLTDISGKSPTRTAINLPLPDGEHLRVFCSSEVSSHDLPGEFRPAVNLFISIPRSVDRDIELESFLQKMFLLQNTYGGLFSRVDFGDKGTNLLMFWGAPIAQENDVERALNFFLDLLKETKTSIIAGITYRLAYAGYMGSTMQEEYTCYGWGVSLAARLMMAANPGEIWTDEEIARRAGQRFSFQYVGKQKFKGFAQEQNVFKLLKRKESVRTVFGGRFVGRESELETLSRFVAPIWSGNFAGLITVIGDPGIGKSRLVHAFQSSKLFSDKKAYWAVCQTNEIIRQSLNPFRYWLKQYFNISEVEDETEHIQAFDQKIDALIASIAESELSQALNKTRSFLGELVGLHWEGSAYEKMDAQGRYDNTLIALSTLLRMESLRQPLVILLEDVHLLDNDTRDFLTYLERTLTAEIQKSYPIAIVATSRRGGDRIALEHAPSKEIFLHELADTDLLLMAEQLLDGRVAPLLLDVLTKRTEGNPFFIEQIIRYLQEEGKLEKSSTGWQVNSEKTLETLPTDISAILISRLDRLTHEVRDVVQTASVLGREFELRLLSKMLDEDETLPVKIQLGVDAEILSALTEIRFIFRHALLRDAAYNMQLKTRQQELHRIAASAFENLYNDQLTPHYYEIAYHADRAGLVDKAKNYYTLAGAEAGRAYKNNLAIESYTRALALSSIEDIQERIELLLARVALYRIIADRGGQEQDLAVLELLADRQQNEQNRAIVMLRQADLALDLGNYQEAQNLAQSAIKIAESVDSLNIAANAYKTLPLALARQGQINQAILEGHTGLELTQRVGDRESEGQTLNHLGLIAMEQRELEHARTYFEKSLLIAQEIGNRRLEAQVLNNMGAISGNIESNFAIARRYFEKTLEIVQEMGNRIGESFALGNLGWVASKQGDFEQARIYQEESLRVARETGNRYQETYTLINLSGLMVSQDNFSAALTYANQSIYSAKKLGDHSAEAWALTCLGHAHLGSGDFHEARKAYQMALDIRQSHAQKSLAMEPLAGLAQVALEKNEPLVARMHVDNILSHLSTDGNLYGTEEPLRIHLTVYLTLLKIQDPRADHVLEEAHSLLQDQVNKIQDQTNREMYVQNVPWRRKIEELWQQNQEY